MENVIWIEGVIAWTILVGLILVLVAVLTGKIKGSEDDES